MTGLAHEVFIELDHSLLQLLKNLNAFFLADHIVLSPNLVFFSDMTAPLLV
jgi:hypothetical protein